MKYVLEIDFETERHCLLCPVRDEESDNCRMQYSKEFANWEEKMKDCPLKLADEHCRDDGPLSCYTCIEYCDEWLDEINGQTTTKVEYPNLFTGTTK